MCLPKNIQYHINMLYKENKKDMSKYKYHKDVVYKEKTKKVCKMNFNG